MSALQDPYRYHSLDALRGSMMVLGIYLHAAVAYSEHGNWPWKDGSTTRLFDVSLGLIHAFRMPVFYVMAGFFAALLIERRGAVGFARNRGIRILVPFVAGWVVLFPLVKLLALAARRLEDPAAMPPSGFSAREVLGHLDPMHLWFLEYLLLFYAITLVAIPLSRRLPLLVAGIDRMFRAVVISPLGPCALAVMTFPILCFMQDAAIDDPSGFAPEGRIVSAYLTFFACGGLLWRNADLLPDQGRFPRAPIFLMAGAVGALLGYSIWYWQRSTGTHALPGLLASAWFLALAMWLFVFGFIGIFLRVFERSRPWLRYLSDSSYWLYLVHMPVLLAFQIAVTETGWTPAVKASAVFAASVATLLLSYHVLVRSTWVGVILNGRKYPTRHKGALSAERRAELSTGR
jgi:glucan biosynthesis protein C